MDIIEFENKVVALLNEGKNCFPASVILGLLQHCLWQEEAFCKQRAFKIADERDETRAKAKKPRARKRNPTDKAG